MLFLAVAILLSWKGILAGLGNALVEDDGVQKAQAAVVLGGDSNGVRVLKAAQLAQAGYVPYILVDSPKTLTGAEADATIPYAESRGYPATLFRPVPFPKNVNSTQSEAGFVGKKLKADGIRKILLVTSNYHTHRAAYLFRKENPGLVVVAIAAADPDFNPDSWWTYRDGQKTFALEWIKTMASYAGL